MPIRKLPAGLLLATLVACSQSPAPERGATPATGSAAESSDPAPARPGADETADRGDCDLLAASEIADAFAGGLSVERAGGRGARGSGCTYSLAEVDEAQLILQTGNRDAFDQRKEAYAAQSAVSMEALELGQEAWLVNGAQVIAVTDGGDSVSLGLLMVVFDQPAPVDAAQTREGLTTLARTTLDRLQAQSPR